MCRVRLNKKKWLRLSIAFNKLVKVLLTITKYKCIQTQLNKLIKIMNKSHDAMYARLNLIS
jgi:hypothetical protein